MTIDNNLEAAIDIVGRDEVFRRARELGWKSQTPPKYVWWKIISELDRKASESLRKTCQKVLNTPWRYEPNRQFLKLVVKEEKK